MKTIRDKHTGMTAAILRSLVRYDSETGLFYSLLGGRGRSTTKPLGTLTPNGYIRIEFTQFGRFGFLAHRLAWLYVTGEWPEDEVDHRNLKKSDNRFDNLREAGNDQNQANRGIRPHNTSGITGVSFHKSVGKWYCELSIGGVRYLHAYFNCFGKAFKARKDALALHGDFAHRR